MNKAFLILESLTDNLKKMFNEESDHYPFKHKKNLGQGPRGHHHNQARKWDCDSCGRENGETYCDCDGIGSNEGHHKHVVIDTAYKHAYNKQYKAGKYPHWRERRSSRKERKKSGE